MDFVQLGGLLMAWGRCSRVGALVAKVHELLLRYRDGFALVEGQGHSANFVVASWRQWGFAGPREASLEDL